MKLKNIANKRNRILLRELVITDFKLRYQNSALGYVWSILKPLLLFVILYVVFDRFLQLGREIEYFPVYLLLGIVLWSFFVEATGLGLQSIVGRGDLIRKINFPKYIIVISGTISSLINLGINLAIVGVFMVINGVPVSWDALLVIPLIAELYILSLSLAFLLGALNVKYRDTGYLWEVFLQGAFYATPILYPLGMVINQSYVAAQLLMLNPLAQIIQDIRAVLVTDQTVTIYEMFSNPLYIMIPFLTVALLVVVSTIYFKKHSGKFAEEV